MKELWNILWVESGWARLTIKERIKMMYFILSLFLVWGTERNVYGGVGEKMDDVL